MNPITEAAFIATIGYERASASFAAEVLAPSAIVGGIGLAGVSIPVYRFLHPSTSSRMPGARRRLRFGTPSTKGSIVRPRKRQRVSRRLGRTGGFTGQLKYVDYEYDAAIVSTLAGSEADPGTALSLNAVAVGDGANTRDALKTTAISCLIKGEIFFNAETQANPEGSHAVRIIVLQDRQTNGAQMAAENAFVDPTNTDLDIHALKNLEYNYRFRILKDFIIHRPDATAVWNGTNSVTGEAIIPFVCWVPCKGMATHYNNTTAAIGSISDNSLHVVAIATTGTSASLKYLSRFRFH